MKRPLTELGPRDFEHALLDAARSDSTGPRPDAAWARFSVAAASLDRAASLDPAESSNTESPAGTAGSKPTSQPSLPSKPTGSGGAPTPAAAPAVATKLLALAAVAGLGAAAATLALTTSVGNSPGGEHASNSASASSFESTAASALPDAVPPPAALERPPITGSAASETTPARAHGESLRLTPSTAVNTHLSLADEVRLMDAARQALSSGGAARARTLIAEHRRRFPRGALTTDIAYLEIEALHAQGRTVELRRLGAAFLARYPRDTHASRVRHLLEQ